MSELKEWHEKEFNELIKSKEAGIVEFGAPWCAACKISEPALMEASGENKTIIFAKIDVAKNPGLASKMGVMSLPNVLIIKSGKVVDQIIGSVTKKALAERIKKVLPAM